MLHLTAAVDCLMMALRMGYFLDNHFANTSIFSLIDLSAANIAKISLFLFLVDVQLLSLF